jgi:hypothetical protein
LVSDWDRHVPTIRRNLATMRRAGSCSALYLDRWEQLLAAGPETLCEVVLADTDEGQVLRSVHPLAGILAPHERWRVLEGEAAAR